METHTLLGGIIIILMFTNIVLAGAVAFMVTRVRPIHSKKNDDYDAHLEPELEQPLINNDRPSCFVF